GSERRLNRGRISDDRRGEQGFEAALDSQSGKLDVLLEAWPARKARFPGDHQLGLAEGERGGEHLRDGLPARAGQVTNDAFGGLEAAVAVTPAQLLGSLALLLEVEVEARIACFGHETTFHSSGVRFAGWKTVRGRMSIEGSRRAQPFPRTGRTLEGAGVSI